MHQCYPEHERSLSHLLCGLRQHHRQHKGPFACIVMNCLLEPLCHAQVQHNCICDAVEHHRMQPAPGAMEYKLLRDSAVAALQILYLEVVSLGILLGKSEANKGLCTDIGESCCSQLHLIYGCNHECSLQQRYLATLCSVPPSSTIVTSLLVCPLT